MLQFDSIKVDFEKEDNLERWAKRCTNLFTKKVKKALFEENGQHGLDDL